MLRTAGACSPPASLSAAPVWRDNGVQEEGHGRLLYPVRCHCFRAPFSRAAVMAVDFRSHAVIGCRRPPVVTRGERSHTFERSVVCVWGCSEAQVDPGLPPSARPPGCLPACLPGCRSEHPRGAMHSVAPLDPAMQHSPQAASPGCPAGLTFGARFARPQHDGKSQDSAGGVASQPTACTCLGLLTRIVPTAGPAESLEFVGNHFLSCSDNLINI